MSQLTQILTQIEAGDPRAAESLLPLVYEDLRKLAAAKVVELRRFAGRGHEDIAEILGITVYQARQKWTYARAWLKEAIRELSVFENTQQDFPKSQHSAGFSQNLVLGILQALTRLRLRQTI